ncbi:unnamed protein product [Lepeophtheirus salmonis]|uniref:(salmon louse) hypothetical protein n=1 Tax=Lepeophtheirus salmonis TaxID=72036 RepID=A0A7R8H5S0_LEPSM|nr:unnamed protein product [Lepeophtheirus salmonis]CAF2885932.1 unnamed protein product [Lepeophtheirus salmonis]
MLYPMQQGMHPGLTLLVGSNVHKRASLVCRNESKRFKQRKGSHGSNPNLSAQHSINTHPNIEERARIAFNAYDRNREGFLTKSKLKKTSKNMTDAQIDAVFEKYDKNRDGRLNFDEFKGLMESNQRQGGNNSGQQ